MYHCDTDKSIDCCDQLLDLKKTNGALEGAKDYRKVTKKIRNEIEIKRSIDMPISGDGNMPQNQQEQSIIS